MMARAAVNVGRAAKQTRIAQSKVGKEYWSIEYFKKKEAG
jgi:hypothetical protein